MHQDTEYATVKFTNATISNQNVNAENKPNTPPPAYSSPTATDTATNTTKNDLEYVEIVFDRPKQNNHEDLAPLYENMSITKDKSFWTRKRMIIFIVVLTVIVIVVITAIVLIVLAASGKRNIFSF